MKTVYLLLTRSDTVLSRVVRQMTASHYTYVSSAFDESLQPCRKVIRFLIFHKQNANNPQTIMPYHSTCQQAKAEHQTNLIRERSGAKGCPA